MTRIDAHQHFWSLARGDYDWLTPDLAPLHRDFGMADLLPLTAACAIDGTIAVQAAATLAETRFLLSLAEDEPRIRGVVGWIDLPAPDAVAQLAELAQHPRLIGIRPMLQDLPRDDWILDPDKTPAMDAIAGHGLVFDALIRPRHIPHVVTLAKRHPALSIVVDHAAKPAIGEHAGFDAWAAGIAALATLPNVACKLSGLLTEAPIGADAAMLRPYVDTLLGTFGADRLIWGSDWPVLLLASEYRDWSAMTDTLLAGLDPMAQAAIRGGNACRIYKL